MSMNDIFFCEVVCLLAYETQYTACHFSWPYVIKCIN